MEEVWHKVASAGIMDYAAAAGIALSVVQYWMKTMIPLRVIAITTNVLFLIYATLAGVYPTLILNCILLPLNLWRLSEMRKLVREAENASRSDLDMSWLQPFMSRRRVEAGEILFHKGDVADAMYLVTSGRFVLSEINLAVAIGTVVGELGMLAPERRRTLSLVCVEAGEVQALAYDRFEELYFQNPSFGLSFLKLTTGRLFQNIARLENELAAVKAFPPPIS
jgi:CRP/FNR family transcriptional regulator, cyclic AMP receptor protein